MKTHKKFALLMVASLVGSLMLVSGAAMAQATNSASATATAVVVAPITVSKTADMVIGNLVAGNGTVTVSTTGVRTKTGGIPFSTSGDTPVAAQFTVTGTANNSFSLDYTGSSNSLSSGPNNLPVDWITEVASAASGKTVATSDATTGALIAGVATIWAGAALSVGASQPAGTYTGTLAITVAYN